MRAARTTAPGAGAARSRSAADGRGRLGARPAIGDVLLDPARQVADAAAVVERVDVVADPLDEVAIVGDDDERARPPVEEVLERGERLDVEVVGRLVEQEHVRLAHQQPHELQAPPFAAGEVAHERPGAVAAEAEAIAEQPGGDLDAAAERRDGADALQRLEHALVAGDLRRVLGEVGEADRRAAVDPPVGGLELAREQLDERRLARAVDADERDPVARAQPPGDVAQHDVRPVGERDVLGLEHLVAEPRGGEPQQLGAVARRGLVGDQRVGGLDAEPRLASCAPAGRAAARRAPCAAAAGGAPRAPRRRRSRSARAST